MSLSSTSLKAQTNSLRYTKKGRPKKAAEILILVSCLEHSVEARSQLAGEVAVWIESANRLAGISLLVDDDD